MTGDLFETRSPDLAFEEHARAEKLRLELRKERRRREAYRMALANALGFIKSHAIGNSVEGLHVRKHIVKTLRRAA